MHAVKRQALDMKDALLTGRMDRVGELLHEGFEAKKRMARSISNPMIEEIYHTALEAGALGGKVLGAGGGGFMAFYCPDIRRYRVMKSLEKFAGSFRAYQFVPETRRRSHRTDRSGHRVRFGTADTAAEE